MELNELPSTQLRLTGTLLSFQEEAVRFAIDRKRVFIADDMGLGKFLRNGSKILTEDGWGEIEKLKIGDQVYGRDGKLHEITGVYPQGKQLIYQIVFSDHTSIYAGLEHLWTARSNNDRKRNHPWRVLTTNSILDKICYANGSPIWEIPLCEAIDYPTKELLIPPYLMGVLLADGGLTNAGVTFVPGDSEVPEIVAGFLSPTYEIRKNADYGTSTRYSICPKKRQRHNPFSTYLYKEKLHIAGDKKFIPQTYLQGSINQRKQLLAGLLDSDGTVKKARVRYSTGSIQLATNIVELVQSLGGLAVISETPEREKIRDGRINHESVNYQISIRLPFNPFLKPTNRIKWRRSSKLIRNIVNVVYHGEVEATCIAVEGNEKLYITENFIVTHNTIEAIATVAETRAYPVLVLCPASVKYNWRNEINKWLPGRSAIVLNGLDAYPRAEDYKADFVITNYDLLAGRKNKKDTTKSKEGHGRMLKLVGFQTVICDESHVLAHRESARTTIVKEIAGGAEYVLLLSGTPIINGPSDLITQLQILKRLENDFGGWFKFISRYCKGHKVMKGKCLRCNHSEFAHPRTGPGERICKQSGCRCRQYEGRIKFWDVSGAANLSELNQRLKETCFIRRKKEEVLQDLPPKRRSTVVMEIDNPEEYTKAEDELITWLREQVEKDEKFLQSIAELPENERQRAIIDRQDSVEEKARRAQEIVKIEKLKQVAVKGKMKMVIEWIDEFLESGEKLIIFANHTAVQEKLITKYDALHIVSADGAEEREATRQIFQSDPTKKIIVISLEAGGIGITLTAASNVVFVELGWTPKSHRQAEDRAHRIGQKDSVTCYYLTAIGTIEEDITHLLKEKATIVDAIVDGIDQTEAENSVLGETLNRLRER